MPWSTRELAEMAGTTVNTVRHYHRLGLLAEPERRYNGYKQYDVGHLVRLLRIRRLADLGVPLGQIDGMLDADDAGGAEGTLRALDAELAAQISRLERARTEIADLLREHAPADAPAGFAAVARRLSTADSSLIHVYTQLYDRGAMRDLARMVEADGTAPGVQAEIDALTPDADEPTRIRLAEALAPEIERNLREYPWLLAPAEHLSRSERVTRETFVQAAVELYNEAQREVLARASAIATARIAEHPST